MLIQCGGCSAVHASTLEACPNCGRCPACGSRRVDANPVSQPRGCPGGALEDVVGRIQAVAAGVVGVGALSDAATGMPPQAHDPGEQQLAGSEAEGCVKMGASAATIGTWTVSWSTWGTSQSFGFSNTPKATRNPLPLHPSGCPCLVVCSPKRAKAQRRK